MMSKIVGVNSDVRQRVYSSILQHHLTHERQMALFSGPRQVGKTTLCRAHADAYFSWDNPEHRRTLLRGPDAIAEAAGIEQLRASPPIVVLDEIHKHTKWKRLLKGLFDTWEGRMRIVVTGSARLDVFRRGGDSLMGRYFLYRMHPWSVGECLHTDLPDAPIRPPAPLADEDWAALWEHGGFPEPFLRRDPRFSRRWRELRIDLLMREDTREVARIEDIGALEILGQILAEGSGSQLIYANLARDVGVTVDTIRRWVDLLERLYFGFRVSPWFKNVPRSLRKEPKWFLRDWSGIADEGARAETFIGCHLLKAVECWTDMGLGKFDLRYLRDKEKREVDFVVVRDRKPWFLVEAKLSSGSLSPHLRHFQETTGAAHAFQCVLGADFIEADCFLKNTPTVVPARTLLSQLV